MRVYLDDLRPAPEGWVRVFWPEEAITLLKTGLVTEISLDHDLGSEHGGRHYKVSLRCYQEQGELSLMSKAQLRKL